SVVTEEDQAAARPAANCRVLVGGVGNPWLRDLDFGPQFIRRVRDMEWPDDVVFEDLATAAHRVLHILQDLQPERVIMVAGFPRGDAPGTIRKTDADIEMPDDEEIQERLGEAAGGVIDFDHTLIVARHFNALPEDTVLIEIEATDTAFGTGFSPEVEESMDAVIEMVRKEIQR
ncbi:MAG: hydrogenase maturation protease, partial [Actinomycetota bacterium]